MTKKSTLTLTLITILIGFMFAVQYNSTKQVNVRDTRDIWKLREDILEAKEMESKLLKEYRETQARIAKYEEDRLRSPELILNETLDELREEAGMKTIKGPGLIFTFRKATEFIIPGQSEVFISPDLLRKLLNELNMAGAQAVSIANQRIVSTTSIREIQGETKVDGFPLRTFPFEVKVITKDKETTNRLYNRMQISSITTDFIIDNIRVSISEPINEVIIPAHTNAINVQTMEPINEEGGL